MLRRLNFLPTFGVVALIGCAPAPKIDTHAEANAVR
jgi:hypothetical protein